jgi:hypothetical protein
VTAATCASSRPARRLNGLDGYRTEVEMNYRSGGIGIVGVIVIILVVLFLLGRL